MILRQPESETASLPSPYYLLLYGQGRWYVSMLGS